MMNWQGVPKARKTWQRVRTLVFRWEGPGRYGSSKPGLGRASPGLRPHNQPWIKPDRTFDRRQRAHRFARVGADEERSPAARHPAFEDLRRLHIEPVVFWRCENDVRAPGVRLRACCARS